jgi:PAS domain S-box-containing protein
MKKTDKLISLRTEAEDEQYYSPVTEQVALSAEHWHHEFQTYQVELEMQNEELRRTQIMLQASNERYVDLYDNAPVGYLTLTDEGLISEINLTAAEFFGMTRKKLLTRRFATLVSPIDRDRWYLFCRKIMTRNQRLNIEASLIGKNNSKVPVQLDCVSVNSMLRITLTDISIIKLVEATAATTSAAATAATAATAANAAAAATASAIYDNEAIVMAVATAVEEATNAATAAAAAVYQADMLAEHMQLAMVQKDAFDRLEKIASQLPGVVYQFKLHANGRFCFPYVSEGIREIFRLVPKEVCEDASKVFELFHPEDYESVRASLHKSAKDMTHWSYEFRVKFEDGTIRWLLGKASPQREVDDSTIWHGFIGDITERKQMENDLRESEFVCNFAIDGSGDGLWDRNFQTDEIKYSRRWKEMLGYAEHDILPTRQEWLNLIYPDDRMRVDIALQAYLNGELKFYACEYRLRCKDGSYIWVLARGTVVNYSKDGSPLRMIGTHTDISKIKRQEQQSKEHLAQLAHVTRLGLMGEMASGLAHEVNQPLCAISTYTQVIINLINKENLDLIKLAEIAAKTQQQALRAGQIINRMKNFCKSKIGVQSSVDINSLIGNCVELCHAELINNSVNLSVELEDKLPIVHIDQLQIEQVLINLIRNSIDAFHSVVEQQRVLTIQSYSSPNNTISVSVQDNGCGLDEDLQKNMMTPFYTTKTEGMGMGLAICRSLIEAHEGTLLFNSTPGKGTTFYFTLPVRE